MKKHKVKGVFTLPNSKQNANHKEVCAICGKPYCNGEKGGGWGNRHFGCNPDPLFPENESARVCEQCNGDYVIPARLFQMSHPDAGREVFRKITQTVIHRARIGA